MPADELVDAPQARRRRQRQLGSPWRSSPSSRRISPSACSPACSMTSSAWRVSSRSASSIRRPPRACRTMTLIAWATTSCSSRAIRVRSSATASCARTSTAATRTRSRSAAVAGIASDRPRPTEQDREEGDVGEGDRIAGLDRRQRDGHHHHGHADDQRAPARVPSGRVDGEQEPHEERAGLRERGGREVGQLDDEQRERKRHERRAAAPRQRGAERERRGEADRAIAREGRLGGDLDAIGHGQRRGGQAVGVARRELPRVHRRRRYLRVRPCAIARAGDVRAQDRSRERAQMATAADVRAPRRWDRLRRRVANDQTRRTS